MFKSFTIIKYAFYLMISVSSSLLAMDLPENDILSQFDSQKGDFYRWMSGFSNTDTKFENHFLCNPIREIVAGLSRYGATELESSSKLFRILLGFAEHSLLAPSILRHVKELIDSEVLFEKWKATKDDEFALSPVVKILDELTEGAQRLSTPNRIIELHEVPVKLKVNDKLLADKLIMLYNSTLKSKEAHEFYLANVDDILEMRVAITLAELRESLFQTLMPADHKDRDCQERYLKNKFAHYFGLIGNFEAEDIKKINRAYQRQSINSLRSLIIKGTSGSDKITYLREGSPISWLHTMGPRKGQGYDNPQVLFEYVFNNQRYLDINLFRKRMQAQYGDNSVQKINEYYSTDEDRFTLAGVKALLYSLGYLEAA